MANYHKLVYRDSYDEGCGVTVKILERLWLEGLTSEHLQNTYVDVMSKTYIYNPPVFIRIGYKIFYNFIDPDTRKKIDIVYKNKQVVSINELCNDNNNNIKI